MMKRRISAAIGGSALALALALTGCSGGEDRTGTTDGSAEVEVEATDADVAFVTGMIPHHEQAVEMSDILLAKSGLIPEIEALAQEIKDAQQPEIDEMHAWLEAWGVEYAPADGHAGHGDGMMSDEDLAALEAADGAEASRLFLEQMIVHHEGAVEMAETALADASNADVLALAQQVIDDQTAEIELMRQLLAQ